MNLIKNISNLKPPKCKHCKQTFTKTQPLQVACSYGCAIALAKPIAKKVIVKKERERNKSLKEKAMTYTQKVNKVKELAQKVARLRDKHLPCISCGTFIANPCFDGGHYKKAETYRGVMFNLDNIHKQCRQDNFFKGGKELEYRVSLIERIGIERVEALELLAEETKRKKWSVDELEEITKNLKIMLKELEK